MNRNATIGLIVGVVVATLVLIIVLNRPGKHPCELRQEVPTYDSEQSKNVTSKNNVAIANFAGYLGFPNDTNRSEIVNEYLPLELVSISQEGTLNGSSQANLTLSTSCCNIKLHHTLDPDNKSNYLISMVIENIVGNRNVTSCHVAEFLTTKLKQDQFYFCRDSKVHYCKDMEENTVATFVFHQLEFEIDGNPDIIKQGRFSKQQYICTSMDN